MQMPNKEKSFKTKVKSLTSNLVRSEKLTLLLALVAILIVFQCLNKNYLTRNNIINILLSMSISGLVAVGETYLAVAGHMDMSCGAVAAFSGVLVSKLMMEFGFAPFAAVPVVLVAGACVGLINAFLVNWLRFNHFIATLATKSIFRGMAYLICNGKSIYINNESFTKLGTGRFLGVPIPVYIFIVVIFIFGFILSSTRFGRSIYMIGGNATAARLAGLNQKKVKSIIFALTSMLSALGGVILAARINSGQPSSSATLEFDAITGAVLGGVALSGGIGTMGGCLIGLLIMNAFNNGLSVMNVQTFWQDVSKGLLLVAALTLDYVRTRQRESIKFS